VSSTWVTVLSASGGIIAAVIGYFGIRLTQRQAVKAQQATIEIEKDKVDVQAYAEARTTWESLIKDLRKQVDDQRKESDRFRTRLEDLEQKRRGDRVAIHVLTEYARQLLWVLREHNIQPPPTPEGLDMDR
jgi:hypothetical protein